METNIGIPQEHLKEVALELNKALADEFVLYTKTRNYHWNIEGRNFMEMHKFYETQFEELDEIVDDVAERVRALGHYSEGRLKDFLSLTHLDEPTYTNRQEEQLKNLLSDHETIIQNLRKLITVFSDKHKDIGTSDFVTGIMEKHEKMAWFIRSYLK
ncbi:MAG TPA: DNA starvation/stationary phase protection protein [Cyclobacteriaceae bacterium]|nr:DNA starvation/stationary phase protection protein [Cyclobacteriaceae bacterium]